MELMNIHLAFGGEATINPAHVVELRRLGTGGASLILSTGRSLEISELESRRLATGFRLPVAGTERIQESNGAA